MVRYWVDGETLVGPIVAAAAAAAAAAVVAVVERTGLAWKVEPTVRASPVDSEHSNWRLVVVAAAAVALVVDVSVPHWMLEGTRKALPVVYLPDGRPVRSACWLLLCRRRWWYVSVMRIGQKRLLLMM